MSDPKKSLLKTLGRHLFTDDASLEQAAPAPLEQAQAAPAAPLDETPAPVVETPPPIEEEDQPPRASSERFSEAERIAKENAAKRKAAADEINAREAPDAAARAAESAKAAAAESAAKVKAEAKKKKVRSEPLPEVKHEDIRPEPAAEKYSPAKTPSEHLGFEPDEDVQDYLDTVRWAESRDPKLNGAFDKEVARIRTYREFQQKWSEENPGETFNPASAELADGSTFAAMQRKVAPVIDGAMQRRLERQRIEEQAAARATRASGKRIDELERRQRENEVRPQIDNRTSKIENEVLTGIQIDEDPEIDTELKKLIAEKGIKALADELPDEGGIVSNIIEKTKASVRELLYLRQGIKPYDSGNPYHAYLSDVIARAGTFFKTSGGSERIRDGRQFVTPEEFNNLTDAARSRYWTFNDDDLTNIITHNAGEAIRRDLDTRRTAKKKNEEARARFKPKAAITPVGNQTAPTAPRQASPRVSPSPSGGPSAIPPKPALGRVASLLLG